MTMLKIILYKQVNSIDVALSGIRKAPSKPDVVCFSMEHEPHCSVDSGSSNGFELDLQKQKMLVSLSS